MIPVPPPNTRAHPYRGLSVQDVEVPLTEPSVRDWLVGREVYRRTEFLALRNGGDTALVVVRRADPAPLFSPVVELRWLAGPDEVEFVHAPDTDVGNASALAEAIRTHGRASARAHVVQGRYEHINFVYDLDPVPITVVEVVPPHPAKLHDQARRVAAFDEDLPPLDLHLDALDVTALAADNPADTYLLPCRGSGVELPGDVAFLDTRPAERADWTLIGCERSLQFHEHFYGDTPPRVELCPLRRAAHRPDGERLLVKCCLRERGIEVVGNLAVVPWGADLDEVRLALRTLAGLGPPTAAAPISELSVAGVLAEERSEA